ncbi:phage tail tape measure protein [Silvimonas sp.]|uniref:phage tail tape measure protein n=1 Tax=Silvimonas sp. TaxID=2650811 RepID=UPI002847C712|nr:phage tail tape measure protein [Silvimonas sp.]MDR3429695.1 phage tail tape measure protein [Silvimonas sp.]
MAGGNEMKLRVILDAVDRATRPLRQVVGSSSAVAKSIKAAREQLKSLNKAQEQVTALRDLQAQTRATAISMKSAQAYAKALGTQLERTTHPTREMVREFKQADKAAAALKLKHAQQAQELLRLRGAMNAAGVKHLIQHEQQLKTQTDAATVALAKQERVLERHNKVAQRMHGARSGYDKTIGARDRVGGAGVATSVAGAAVGLPIVKMVKDYSSWEDAMLGVAKQVEGARDASGKLTRIYYDMGDGIKAMAERVPMATTEIAALVEAGARMGIQGKENLLIFAETTAITATAFELPVDQVGEDMGKLAGLYKVPVKNIAQLGDAINYLDDNALSKGSDIIDVMKRVAGTAATVNMGFKDAAALGSTFLSLGASAEIAATASNAMMRELAIANMQPARFKKGLAALRMDAAKVQKDMSKDATGTILKVLDAINLLPKDKQLEITTQLFGKEYGDDAAKLANNVGEYRKQLELVNDAKARGSMYSESAAKNDTLTAQLQMLKNKAFNQSSGLGATLRQPLMDVMRSVGGIITAITGWTKANPQLVAALVKITAVLAILLVLLGGLMLAVAAVLGPLAVMKLSMAVLGIKGASLGSMLWNIGAKVLPFLGRALLVVGRAMLLNPVGLAITGIAVAALLIYRYWAPISGFFAARWAEIKAAFGGGIGGIAALVLNWSPLGLFYKAFAGVLSWFGIDLPAKFTGFGAMILTGLANGITGALGAVRTAITGAADSTIGWFKERLGIHSPSRVFAQLGGFTMAGLDHGIQAGQSGPLKSVAGLGKKLAAVGAGISIGTAGAAGIPLDKRPAMAASAGAASSGGGIVINQLTIAITTAPGADNVAIGQQVRAEFEKLVREQQARSRSRLQDKD